MPADRERGRRGGRRGVHDVHRPGRHADLEVVHQASVGGYRLRPHPGPAPIEVADPDVRHQLLQGPHESRLAGRAVHLVGADAPVLARHVPEAGVAQRARELGGPHRAEGVALAREGQHRIRARFHVAVDGAGEVHAEERELGIRYRVDQAAHDRAALGPQHVVLAAERDDAHLGRHPGEPGHSIGVEPAAVDEVTRLHRALRGLEHEPGRLAADRAHSGPGLDPPTALLDQLRHLARHLDVVHDPGLGHVDRPHRAAVRLELPDFLRRQHLEPGEAVGLPALVDILQPRQLGRVGRHDDLAAALPLDAVGVAELLHPARPVHAGPRLERAGLVVDAGVDDPAVVTGLVGRDLRFLLQQDQPEARMGLGQGQRGGEADDAASHDREIGALGHGRENTITPSPPGEGRGLAQLEHDRAVIRAQDPGQDARARDPAAQLVGHEEVVDAPAHVPGPRPRLQVPPRVVAGVRDEEPEGVVVAGRDEAGDPLALGGQEARRPLVLPRAGEIELGVGGVHVAADHDALAPLAQRLGEGEERLVEGELVLHALRPHASVGEVHVQEVEVG